MWYIAFSMIWQSFYSGYYLLLQISYNSLYVITN
jgi:hypothetical protein